MRTVITFALTFDPPVFFTTIASPDPDALALTAAANNCGEPVVKYLIASGVYPLGTDIPSWFAVIAQVPPLAISVATL